MKEKFLFWTMLLLLALPASRGYAAYQEDDPGLTPPSGQNAPQQFDDREPYKRSGWFLGSEQGVLLFLGNSSNLVDPQYLGTLFGGYRIQGWVYPYLRMSQAIGSLGGFFNPTTFFFMLEGGVKFTPLRTFIRPFFQGGLGFYVLDFTQFGSTVQTGVDFTAHGGGGIEFCFGHSSINLSSNYRIFQNGGPDLQAVEATLGYSWQF